MRRSTYRSRIVGWFLRSRRIRPISRFFFIHVYTPRFRQENVCRNIAKHVCCYTSNARTDKSDQTRSIQTETFPHKNLTALKAHPQRTNPENSHSILAPSGLPHATTLHAQLHHALTSCLAADKANRQIPPSLGPGLASQHAPEESRHTEASKQPCACARWIYPARSSRRCLVVQPNALSARGGNDHRTPRESLRYTPRTPTTGRSHSAHTSAQLTSQLCTAWGSNLPTRSAGYRGYRAKIATLNQVRYLATNWSLKSTVDSTPRASAGPNQDFKIGKLFFGVSSRMTALFQYSFREPRKRKPLQDMRNHEARGVLCGTRCVSLPITDPRVIEYRPPRPHEKQTDSNSATTG